VQQAPTQTEKRDRPARDFSAYYQRISNNGEAFMDIQAWFSATFTVLAVINPVVTAAMLMRITENMQASAKWRAATKTCGAILLILLAAALGGQYLLKAFGVTMDAFRIVGGVIVAYLGFLMFSGRMLQRTSSSDNPEDLSTVIMFAASPGTIATVITLASVHDGPMGLPLTALIAIVLAVAWTWLMMILSMLFANRINENVQQISNQFMGLILITMGLQFVLDSYKHFMNV
jgi:multiple antibiotic resistance protein